MASQDDKNELARRVGKTMEGLRTFTNDDFDTGALLAPSIWRDKKIKKLAFYNNISKLLVLYVFPFLGSDVL